MNHLQEIRAKVIEVVPEIATTRRRLNVMRNEAEDRTEYRPITLADVLRAIESFSEEWLFVDGKGYFWSRKYSDRDPEITGALWNLALPLDEQEPEVIEFLHKILV